MMHFQRTFQIAFDPLKYTGNIAVGGTERVELTLAEATAVARKHRDIELRARRARGETVRGWSLRGQLQKYASFGNPDGRVRTVYYITVDNRPAAYAADEGREDFHHGC